MSANRRLLVLGSAAALFTLTACASSGARANTAADAPQRAASGANAGDSSPASGSNVSVPRSGSRNRNMLNLADIDGSSAQNMAEVVQRLRPQWLQVTSTRSMGGSSANMGVSVYVDGQRFGSPEALRNISTEMVREARYYSATEAQSRFGLRDAGPVIAITTRK